MAGDIEVVAFDFDGVLNEAFVFSPWLEREYGVTAAERRAFFGGPYIECQEGKADLFEVLPPFLERWGWRGTAESFIATWVEMDDNLDTGVLALVDGLRRAGKRAVVATNQEQHRANAIRGHAALRGRIDGWYFSCELGVRKPGRRFFEQVERALGCGGRQILLIDDDFGNVRAANQCGWQAELSRNAEESHGIVARYGLPTG